MGTAIIFGIEVPSVAVLTIRGVTGDKLPPMSVFTDGAADRDVGFDDQQECWVTELDEGEHVIRIEENFDEELTIEDPVALEVVVEANGQPLSVTFVSTYEVSNSRQQKAWTGDSLTGSDPKDPWPPPGSAVVTPIPTWISQRLDTEEPTVQPLWRSK